VPPVAVHVTAVFELPVTVAVNCCVPLVCRLVDDGLTVTATDEGGTTVDEGFSTKQSASTLLQKT